MRDNFWRADMGGVDWDGVLDRYRPLLDRIATHDDLVDLLWEVHGELGTSHAYVTPPGGYRDAAAPAGPARRGPRPATRTGVWRVDRVLPVETSDPQARSPLAAPGVAVRAGDAIARGRRPAGGPGGRTGAAAGRHRGQAGRADGRPGRRRRPAGTSSWSRSPTRSRCATTTGWPAGGPTSTSRPAGGSATCTSRTWSAPAGRSCTATCGSRWPGRAWSWTCGRTAAATPRSWSSRSWPAGSSAGTCPRGVRPVSYPQDAPRGPVVAVADEFSGSDGDIVNAAIKALGIGPVVGTRTWGGVIGIDSRYQLVDGTAGHPAQVRVLAGGLRLGRGEPRRRPGRRGGAAPRRTGRPAATRSSTTRSPSRWTTLETTPAKTPPPCRRCRRAAPAPVRAGASGRPVACEAARNGTHDEGRHGMAGEPQADCLFCKIVAGDMPATIVRETDDHGRLPRHQPAGAHPRAGHPPGALPRRGLPRRRRAAVARRTCCGEAGEVAERGEDRRHRLPHRLQHRHRAPARPSSTRTPTSWAAAASQWLV